MIDYKTWDNPERAKCYDAKSDTWTSLQLPLYCAMLDVDDDPLFKDAHLENITSAYCLLAKTAEALSRAPIPPPVEADAGWIRDPNRSFPISIDPSFYATYGSMQDLYVSEVFPNTFLTIIRSMTPFSRLSRLPSRITTSCIQSGFRYDSIFFCATSLCT